MGIDSEVGEHLAFVENLLCIVWLRCVTRAESKVSTAKVAYLKTERLLTTLVGWLFVCRAKGLLAQLFGAVVVLGFNETCFGFLRFRRPAASICMTWNW